MGKEEGIAQFSPGRRWAAWTLGLGLLVAAAIMLSGLVFFREDRPVLWPPASATLYSAAFAVAGTAAMAAMTLLVYVTVSIIAVLAGRQGWREFLSKVVLVAAAAVVVVASISVSLKVFYWPWARASAVKTILSNEAKWRLEDSADTLADHWDPQVAEAITAGLSSPSPPVQAAAAYTIAARGEKAYLARLVEIAYKLPAERSDGETPLAENNITSQRDVAWLIKEISGLDAPSMTELTVLISRSGDLVWDARAGRYRPAKGGEPPSGSKRP